MASLRCGTVFFPCSGGFHGAYGRRSLGKKEYVLFFLLSLSLMLLRSNGLFIAALLSVCSAFLRKSWKKEAAVFLLCAVAAIVPGRLILSYHDWQPLFQESMAIPLQQMGRVLVMGGNRSEETAVLMNHLLPEDKWRKNYSPATVDFVKWDDDFKRNDLNREKADFLKAWVDTGLKNPGLYMEGWMTETYALWNLDPWNMACSPVSAGHCPMRIRSIWCLRTMICWLWETSPCPSG